MKALGVNIEEPFFVLVLCQQHKFEQVGGAFLKDLFTAGHKRGIYISVNHGYKKTMQLMKEHSIDSSQLFFIDMITREFELDVTQNDKCVYTSSPKALTEAALMVAEAVQRHPDVHFLYVDSISTLKIYNDEDALLKFVHTLSVSLGDLDMDGVMFFHPSRRGR